jgi:hypothetical protein
LIFLVKRRKLIVKLRAIAGFSVALILIQPGDARARYAVFLLPDQEMLV